MMLVIENGHYAAAAYIHVLFIYLQAQPHKRFRYPQQWYSRYGFQKLLYLMGCEHSIRMILIHSSIVCTILVHMIYLGDSHRNCSGDPLRLVAVHRGLSTIWIYIINFFLKVYGQVSPNVRWNIFVWTSNNETEYVVMIRRETFTKHFEICYPLVLVLGLMVRTITCIVKMHHFFKNLQYSLKVLGQIWYGISLR